ncbi:cysteine desulfurase family protein [Bacillota bacterium Meth-B3]
MRAYLDNSATTRPTEPVIAAMNESMRGGYFNPSSLYAPALEAERALSACRARILKALHEQGGRVVFTSGGTESNNLGILGAVRAMRGAQHLITTAAEHPSVLAAFEALAAEGHALTVLKVDREGQLDWDQLEEALHDPPALVSCMQVNNETGAILDIARVCSRVRMCAPEALIHVDGVQGFLREPFDGRLVDLYTLSAHKLNGPKGVGALYARAGVKLKPLLVGGGQEQALRSGTENTPGIAGLNAAIEYMPPDAGARMRTLKLRLLEGLRAGIADVIVNGPAPELGAAHILNVSLMGVRGEVMLHALEGEGIYCSTGSACSSRKRKLSPVLTSMGIAPNVAECALRFSLCPHTTEDEIDFAVKKACGLHRALARFRRK